MAWRMFDSRRFVGMRVGGDFATAGIADARFAHQCTASSLRIAHACAFSLFAAISAALAARCLLRRAPQHSQRGQTSGTMGMGVGDRRRRSERNSAAGSYARHGRWALGGFASLDYGEQLACFDTWAKSGWYCGGDGILACAAGRAYRKNNGMWRK